MKLPFDSARAVPLNRGPSPALPSQRLPRSHSSSTSASLSTLDDEPPLTWIVAVRQRHDGPREGVIVVLSAHATEIQVGDYVAWIDGDEKKRIEARRVLRDCGCVHVHDVARVVTFASMHVVEILR